MIGYGQNFVTSDGNENLRNNDIDILNIKVYNKCTCYFDIRLNNEKVILRGGLSYEKICYVCIAVAIAILNEKLL